jgi:curved DNA-binding protein CbpA
VSSPAEDPYAVLGVGPHATLAEIRAAFRRLAQQHHPDRPAGSAARMAAINRAYAILGNPARRRQYDAQHGASSPSASPPASAAPSASASPPEPAAEVEATPEPPPWLPDLELGRDMDPWRQMYAEERHVWEELLAGQPTGASRQQIEHALQAARRDELDLENAIRQRAGEPPLSHAELDAQHTMTERTRTSAAAQVGCLAIPLLLLRPR